MSRRILPRWSFKSARPSFVTTCAASAISTPCSLHVVIGWRSATLTNRSLRRRTRAGVAKGTFYVHFADRSELVVALHRSFHDELFARIERDTTTVSPGPERVRHRLVAFLDGCRAQPAVRSVLRDMRSDPLISREVMARNRQAAELLAPDLRRARRTGHELETAALLVSATIEVAVRELEVARKIPRLRRALLALVV